MINWLLKVPMPRSQELRPTNCSQFVEFVDPSSSPCVLNQEILFDHYLKHSPMNNLAWQSIFMLYYCCNTVLSRR